MKVYQKLYYALNRTSPDYDTVEDIAKEYLPSGSGFNCGCNVIVEPLWKNRIVIKAEFHALDANGYYRGWYTYKIIVHPAFNGIALKIYGKDYNGLKTYISDCIYNALDMEVVK